MAQFLNLDTSAVYCDYQRFLVKVPWYTQVTFYSASCSFHNDDHNYYETTTLLDGKYYLQNDGSLKRTLWTVSYTHLACTEVKLQLSNPHRSVINVPQAW